MDVRITKPLQGGTVPAITSKSSAHRLLICAALADKETFIHCPQLHDALSEDIDATIRCLQALGANIRHEREGFFVTPVNLRKINKDKPYLLNCGESGATFRFLLPVCAALGLRVSFALGGRLPSRPLSSLRDEMISHGCILSEPGSSPLKCEDQLTNGTFTLPGNITSQYISGLLLALPFLSGDSSIKITDVLESRPYVDMTLDALRLFGVTVHEEGQTFRIPGGQTLISPNSVHAEGDWSNAAFWLCAGAISGAVTCTGLNPASRQGDRAILKLLSSFGANVVCKDDIVTVTPANLCGIDIDAGDIPDLVPVLAAVAASANGKTVIRNAARLRMKESDRLHTVAASLSELGADITETQDGLVIIGKKTLTGGETQSYGDHRIAMTAAVLSAVCSGPVIIKDAQAVRKSYPSFFEDFKTALGGEYEII
ncbi:MAG: 3-phosphoshikimate 1-carboxyvinyltransferase [Treponema sp.]|nr:3-phosphoshikimate 1-carboxyvinyltransferase [Treponema sp.]